MTEFVYKGTLDRILNRLPWTKTHKSLKLANEIVAAHREAIDQAVAQAAMDIMIYGESKVSVAWEDGQMKVTNMRGEAG